MTWLMWFFVSIWGVLFIGLLLFPIFAPDYSPKGFTNTLSHLMGVLLLSAFYWGVLLFLDIKFNFLHWF